MPTIAPYGAWPSPISAALITGTQVGLSSPWLDGDAAYWCESRPVEAGRTHFAAPVGRRHHRGADARTLQPAHAGSRVRRSPVHGAGRRSSSASSSRTSAIYRLDAGAAPVALTPESDGRLRYADLVLDPARRRVLAVREDHRGDGEPVTTLVAVPLDGSPDEGTVLAAGHDFFAYPRPSPDGRSLAWLTWDHPDMPWDATTLWVAELDEGGLPVAPAAVAGGAGESLVQPEWAPDGQLYVMSDRSDFWSLYRVEGRSLTPVALLAAELAGPLWQLGARWYDFVDAGTALAIATQLGRSGLVRIDLATGAGTRLELPFVEYAGLSCAGGRALVQALPDDGPGCLALLDATGGHLTVLATSGALTVGPDWIARPEHMTFASADGRQAFALYYPPTNPDHAAASGELPPLVVRSHGGPTGRASPALNLQVQFWTSRGFAVVDVDYGGSTGYGRAYRSLLDGKWGLLDVEDCIAAARHLAATGRADPERLAIRGGSAGGFTTLCALTFHERLQGWGVLVRDRRSRGPDARHPQVREPLSRPADRPVAGGAGRLSGALADPPHRPAELPGDLPAGRGRQGGAAQSGRGHGRGAAGEGPARRLPRVRG